MDWRRPQTAATEPVALHRGPLGDWLIGDPPGRAFESTGKHRPRGRTAVAGHNTVNTAVRCGASREQAEPSERDNCAPWLKDELALKEVRVVVAWAVATGVDAEGPSGNSAGRCRAKPKFGREPGRPQGVVATARWKNRRILLGCFQRPLNTSTGRLPAPACSMMFSPGRVLAGLGGTQSPGTPAPSVAGKYLTVSRGLTEWGHAREWQGRIREEDRDAWQLLAPP